MKIKFILIILVGVIFSGCVGVASKGIFGTGVTVALDPRTIGTQIDVTNLWRTIKEIFGNCHEKLHRKIADFNRRSTKKSRSVFPPYNMDCV